MIENHKTPAMEKIESLVKSDWKSDRMPEEQFRDLDQIPDQKFKLLICQALLELQEQLDS